MLDHDARIVVFDGDRRGGQMDQGVGQEIKRLREERGWSRAKLAVEADMSVSGVSMIENGQRNLTTTTLAKLARALTVEVPDLFPKDQERLPLEESVSLPLDIDLLKKEVIRESRPANQAELQRGVEDKIEQRHSREELFPLKDELEELRQSLSPKEEDEFNAYAQVLEARNYVHRVLHRSASPQLAGAAEEENEQ
jgi:transcriptional regulator with XRE-family HTH domain